MEEYSPLHVTDANQVSWLRYMYLYPNLTETLPAMPYIEIPIFNGTRFPNKIEQFPTLIFGIFPVYDNDKVGSTALMSDLYNNFPKDVRTQAQNLILSPSVDPINFFNSNTANTNFMHLIAKTHGVDPNTLSGENQTIYWERFNTVANILLQTNSYLPISAFSIMHDPYSYGQTETPFKIDLIIPVIMPAAFSINDLQSELLAWTIKESLVDIAEFKTRMGWR